MQQDSEIPSRTGSVHADSFLSGGAPPVITTEPAHNKPVSVRRLLAGFLSLCLGLFVADGAVSLLDDSLILFFGVHVFAGLRAVVFLFGFLFAVATYVLMGFTPMIPKRFFVPLALFTPVGLIVSVPLLALFFSRLQQVAWVISLSQVLIGLGLLYWVQAGWRLRWPIVSESQLGTRAFSWLNLSGFALANVFVLLPAGMVALFLSASFAVHHLSDGFVGLRPGGMTVQVREYLRDDGKAILLVPMSHVGESDFYQALSDSFPTNALILMEGVTDDQGLLTNRLEYKRMANSLGLVEQEVEFKPRPTKTVHADVDIEEFAPDTIDFMNLVMLSHTKGMTPEVIRTFTQHAPPPGFEQQLLEDLLGKRNRRLLAELHARLEESDSFVVPWGAAHMPEIARGIQESGFQLGDTQDYVAIRFGSDSRDGQTAPGSIRTPSK